MFGFLKNWMVKRAVSKQIKGMNTDELSSVVDEYLKRTQLRHAESLRVADKINKASLLHLQDKQLRESIKRGLDDGDDDDDSDDEEEEKTSVEDQVTQMLLSKILGGAAGGANPLPAAASSIDLSSIPQETKDEFMNIMRGSKDKQ